MFRGIFLYRIILFISFSSAVSGCAFNWSTGKQKPASTTAAAAGPSAYCDKYEQISVVPFVVGINPAPDGTALNPYRICTVGQLNAIAADTALWNKNFKLDASINVSGFVGMLGTTATSFTGIFDGDNHTLSNLTINSPATTDVGFFGLIGAPAEIKNLRLTEISITGGDNTGGLVGRNLSTTATITNCSTSGTVTGGAGADYVGGLVGQMAGPVDSSSSSAVVSAPGIRIGGLVGFATTASATITNSFATGSVSNTAAGGSVGGLVGLTSSGNISNSYATGAVLGLATSTGGLIGGTAGTVTVTNSYSTGTVSGTISVGGLIGGTSTTTTIDNCYHSIGAVLGSSTSVGGLLGSAANTAVTNSYSTSAVTGAGTTGGFVGSAGASNSFTDCYSTGAVTGTGGVSRVGGFAGHVSAATTSLLRVYASGTVSGASYVGGLVGENAGSITDSYKNSGNVSATGSYVGGLAGSVTAAGSITNSTVTLINIATSGTSDRIGGLIGESSGTITNCSVTSNVSGRDNVGGLIGVVVAGSVTGCYTTGTITGTNRVGGLIGQAWASTLSTNYATGNINGTAQQVGGLIGHTAAAGAVISDSYAIGNITGTDYLGGLVGQHAGSISTSFARGDVTSTASAAGGLVGYCTGTITTSGAFGNAFGTTLAGGFAGYSSAAAAISSSFSIGNAKTTAATAGGFIGSAGGTISDSYAMGSALAGSANAGGFVGSNSGTITRSFSRGNAVATTGSAGGFAGANALTISDSFASGNATLLSGTRVGGFAGFCSGTAIRRSFATGNVSGNGASSRVGGFCGDNWSTIEYSYSTGVVSGGVAQVGGFTGGQLAGTPVNVANFWNQDSNPALNDINGANDANVFAETTANMKIQATFTAQGWDFVGEAGNGVNDYWVMTKGADNLGYPRLAVANVAGNPTIAGTHPYAYFCYGNALTNAPYADAGAGTKADPIKICTTAQMNSLNTTSADWGKYIIAGDDIDLTGHTKIGNVTTAFSGTFDGRGYNFTNLNLVGGSYSGMFGYTSGDAGMDGLGDAMVMNVTLINPILATGGDRVGALVGSISTGSVFNSFAVGGSIAGGTSAGGLIGWSSGGYISQGGSSANVSSVTWPAGGFVGYVVGSTIRNAFGKGNVSGSDAVGGFAGFISNGNIHNSYARGGTISVTTAPGRVGGFIGIVNGGGSLLQYSYAAAASFVTAGGTAGGFAGEGGGALKNFWDQTLNPALSDVAPAIDNASIYAETTANMQSATPTVFTTEGWDFNLYWRSPVTAGYPVLPFEHF